MATDQAADFIVRLEGVTLPAELRQQIASDIQGVVLRELAKMDYKGDLYAQMHRKEWYGLIMSSKLLERMALRVTAQL